MADKPKKVQLQPGAPVVDVPIPGAALAQAGKPQRRGPTREGAAAFSHLAQAMSAQQGGAQQQDAPQSGVYVPPNAQPGQMPVEYHHGPPPTMEESELPHNQPPPQKPTPQQEKEADEVLKEDEEDDLNTLDLLNSLDQRTERFNNPKRRKAIESKLQPLDPGQLDDNLEYRQVVKTEALRFLFRSPAHGEIEAVYRIISLEGVGGVYGLNKLGAMLACLGTVSINGKDLPSHLDDKMLFDREKFDKRYVFFSRFPMEIVEDARVQFSWFDDRIAKMLTGDSGLGNG